MSYNDLDKIKGKILRSVEITNSDNSEVLFKTTDNLVFKMYHSQDCCEVVELIDITGDLEDLIGYPILQAEEVSNSTEADDNGRGSLTWTFYNFATIKGYVQLRWKGESNGYYSEEVNFKLLKNK